MKCPETIEELEELEQMLPLCRESLFELAQAKITTGEAKSERDASRQIAEELEVPDETVRKAVQREKKSKVGTVSPPPQCSIKRPKDDFGRTKEPVSAKFYAAFEALCTAITNEKSLGWKTTSKKAALECIEILHSVITIK